jgi:hypothetical protein
MRGRLQRWYVLVRRRRWGANTAACDPSKYMQCQHERHPVWLDRRGLHRRRHAPHRRQPEQECMPRSPAGHRAPASGLRRPAARPGTARQLQPQCTRAAAPVRRCGLGPRGWICWMSRMRIDGSRIIDHPLGVPTLAGKWQLHWHVHENIRHDHSLRSNAPRIAIPTFPPTGRYRQR